MKKYTFHVTGASPYDGEIVIIAKTVKVAKRLAYAALDAYNGSTFFSHISMACDKPDCVPFNPPGIVYFESGEA